MDARSYAERNGLKAPIGEAVLKTLSITLPDDVYQMAERRAAAHGLSLQEHVAELITQSDRVEDSPEVAAAKARMETLFRTVTGFRAEPKIPREELYERGNLR